jgi:hypothetical protein
VVDLTRNHQLLQQVLGCAQRYSPQGKIIAEENRHCQFRVKLGPNLEPLKGSRYNEIGEVNVEVAGVSTRDIQAIQALRDGIAEGRNWYLSLLESVRLWDSWEEDYAGRHYRYLIDDEAFDWLILAGRLCEEVDGLIPEQELINLLFFDRPPIELSRDEFRNFIGEAKYRAYLNYLYGILVETFLLLAVTEEIRKKKRVLGLNSDNGVVDEAYQLIYGDSQLALLKRFRKEKHRPQLKSISLTELNEFTYWLFKYRMKVRDRSRVASDTKKALMKLHEVVRLKGKPVRPSVSER